MNPPDIRWDFLKQFATSLFSRSKIDKSTVMSNGSMKNLSDPPLSISIHSACDFIQLEHSTAPSYTLRDLAGLSQLLQATIGIG
jgi:hypothetical protein